MNDAKTRLNSLIENGKSGIVAYYDDDAVVVWVDPLKTIYAQQEVCDSYRECATAADAERFLACYAGRTDSYPDSVLADPEKEKEYLSDSMWSLLWAMANDYESYEWLIDMPDIPEVDFKRFESVSVMGAETVEKDIAGFLQLVREAGEFSVSLINGKTETFHVSGDYPDDGDGRVYALFKTCPEPFSDESTGETVTVDRYGLIIRAYSVAVLYAKARELVAATATIGDFQRLLAFRRNFSNDF